MNNSAEIQDFLTTRRARITPQQAGLPAFGGNRRVPGLRREELAMLAGVSVDYYTKIERGALAGVSDSVLLAIAEALRLDDTERAHLRDLAAASAPTAKARRSPHVHGVRSGLERIVDTMSAPAVLQNCRHQILHANASAQALYSEVIEGPAQGNYARYIFFDTRARDFYPDWRRVAADNVAMLRTEAARDPYDASLTALIGELSTRSEEFRQLWAAHEVNEHRGGRKRMRHRDVGEIEVDFEALDVAADAGLRIYVYSAEPGTPSADAIALLSSLRAPAAVTARSGSEETASA